MNLLTMQPRSPRQGGSDVLLISCYELGHQPAGLSSPMGFLRREGIDAATMDVSVEGFDATKVSQARFAGISVPMHTALRLGVSIAREIRKHNADCHICFYGLYASLNVDYLLDTVADSVIGGEYESSLVELIKGVLSEHRGKDSGHPADLSPATSGSIPPAGVKTKTHTALPVLERLRFVEPERRTLPSLSRYARLDYNGEERLTGYTEASRGCLHHCTHCPIPSAYGGRFFIVQPDVVQQDIRNLVAQGAQHITFGDPDFLNGPLHARRIVQALHEEFPHLTFDFTAKVEHIIKHKELFPEFAGQGCLFVVSAVESLSDRVLVHLEKGHTRADVIEALNILRGAGIALRPSLVSFTPWTTLDDFIEVLTFVEAENLIDAIDPVQYSIRLLVPPGSLLLKRDETAAWLGDLNQESFTYEWAHPDARMDILQRQVVALVEQAACNNEDRGDREDRKDREDAAATFTRIRALAYAAQGIETASLAQVHLAATRLKPPRLTEAWFC